MPNNRDPYMLRATATVRFTFGKPSIKSSTRIKMLKDAKRDLNRAIKAS